MAVYSFYYCKVVKPSRSSILLSDFGRRTLWLILNAIAMFIEEVSIIKMDDNKMTKIEDFGLWPYNREL